MILCRDNKTGLWYRETTDDLKFLGKEDIMTDHLPLKPTDVVMEIGANIGATTRLLCSQVETVIAYEPQKYGVECIRKNAPKAIVIQAGIGLHNGKSNFYYNPKHLSSASIFSKLTNYGKIEIVSFLQELERWRPTFILMDCEGSEWELLRIKLPDFVRAVAIEFHFQRAIKRHYKKNQVDILAMINRIHDSGPQSLLLSDQFGLPIWTHNFARYENISFAIWRRCVSRKGER